MIPTRPLRRPRLLIVGCGDVGLRTVPPLSRYFKVIALSRRPDGDQRLRDAGAVPLRGDLDSRASLARLARLSGTAFAMFHFAPPAAQGQCDHRTRSLLAGIGASVRIVTEPTGVLAAASRVRGQGATNRRASKFTQKFGMRAVKPVISGECSHWRRGGLPLVYMSTSGVYGDCQGALVDETRQVRPANPRAVRRVSAEQMLRRAGGLGTIKPSILRVPGIYGAGRLPQARLARGTPVLRDEDDVFTSHIHADDLAAIAVRALWRGAKQRIYLATDDSRMKMGAYFTMVADALGLPHPPRISRDQAERELEPMLMSFMRESRQLSNKRMTKELRYVLRYPTVADFLRGGTHAAPEV